ncbi:MAG: hypothetical protein HEP71_25740 [Roseivirga sp.]|nr:hypothetical protein [Roseivirga sp.]
MPEQEKTFNPLKALWNVVSTISGAIGLISLADSWHEWQEQINVLIEHYRNIVYWPFDFVELKLPNWLKDYIFIGSLFVGSLAKAAGKKFWKGGESTEKMNILTTLIVGLFIGLFCLLIWPIGLITLIQSFLAPQFLDVGGLFQPKEFRSAFLWFLASILLFLLVLIGSVIF